MASSHLLDNRPGSSAFSIGHPRPKFTENDKRKYSMRTTIEIDDELMNSALRATGLKTKREIVELGLRTLLQLRQQEDIKRFRGKLNWQGNLDAMRTQ